MVVQVCFPMHLYGEKHLKILFSKTEDALWLNLCIYYWEHLHACSGYVTQVSESWPVGLLFFFSYKIGFDISFEIFSFFSFSFFFKPENWLWHFMQICLVRQFAWNIKAYFLEKIRKIFQNMVCLNCFLRGKGLDKLRRVNLSFSLP